MRGGWQSLDRPRECPTTPMSDRPSLALIWAGETGMREPVARHAGVTTPLAWSRVFPGRPFQVREARRFLAQILRDFPAADDAVLCLSELAANAVTHSNSRRPGGWFTVRAEMRLLDRVRVEVEDQGGSWTRQACADGQHGRGLVIVSQLAPDWGFSGDSETGWTVWFEIACP